MTLLTAGRHPAAAQSLVHVAVSHIPALVATAKPLGRMTPAPKMTVEFVLPLRNQAQLTEKLGRIADPKDPLYGKYMTPQEFADAYGPSSADVGAVAKFAAGKGLAVKDISGNRTLVKVTGSSSVVESAFGVHLNSYQAGDGRVFFAPDREPAFPADLAGRIIGVSGLDSAMIYHPNNRLAPRRPALGDLPAYAQPLGGVQPQGIYGSDPNGNVAPNDVSSIYSISLNGTPGTGQTLAVYELDGYTPSDIDQYNKHYWGFLPDVPLQNVLVDGYNGSAGNGAGEVTLDLEMMIGLCPYATKIICYEGPNGDPGIPDLYARIASDNLASVISSSWGGSEQGTSPTSSAMSENQSFQQMARQGQSFFDASGDIGAYADQSSSSTGTLSVQDPASQPYATTVGGTVLNDTSSSPYTYISESAWGDPSDTSRGISGTGSGGGISAWWPLPSYQTGFANASNKASTTQRNVPDVSLFGSFDEGGYSVYFQGAFAGYNGTSAAAPLWAAYIALVNQQRASHGSPKIGFLNPAVYSLAKNGTTYANDFHDINDGTTNLYYPAVNGYDLATGIGSPKGAALLSDLVAYGTTSAPAITSFTPTSGPVGTSVTITGTAFTGATSVKFHGTAATTFSVASATSITATVPSGATTGTITVTTPAGTATSSASFTVTTTSGPPTITSFSPTSGPVGTSVVITGTNFTGATVVGFTGAHASFTVNSATQITTTVPSGATTGTIAVATSAGTAKSTGTFTVTTGTPAPTITSFTPTSGPVGTSVTITGTAFTGATSVKFHGTAAASYTVASATSITATVPTGTTTGTITVTTAGGTATSSGTFTVTTTSGPPTITSFSPTSGPVGTSVVITGTNFTGATVVGFTGAHASFTVNSATQITTTVPTGAATGTIAVATPNGTAKSAASFTVTTGTPAPTITSFSPTSGPVGTSVVITGTNFTGATSVKFHGTAATSYTVNSATQVTATVAGGTTTGTVTVTTAGGTATSSGTFTVTTTSGPPTITSFSPTSGPVGTSVVITGTNFTGATVVGFTGAHASFTVNSATQITTTVPTGAATGTIAVATPSGTAKSAASFTVTTAQTVTLSNLTASPTSVMSGGASTITVTLTGPAPAGGASVALTINGSAQSPLVVPAGQTSLATSFTINGNPGMLTFTGTYGGVSKSATVTITAPSVTLSALTCSPSTVQESAHFTVTATLTAPAPAGGASVTLTLGTTSESPITIAAGQTSGSVTYTAGTTPGTYTFTASYGGVNKTASFTVVAPAVTMTDFYFNPSEIYGGVDTTTGYVVFSAPLTTALTVRVTSAYGYNETYTCSPQSGVTTYTFTYAPADPSQDYEDTFTAASSAGTLTTNLFVDAF